MTKYAKYISETQIELPPKNKDGICNYDLDTERLIADGYKEYIEAEIPQTNRMYHIIYVETDVITQTIVYDETQEEADAREANNREQEFDRDFFETSLGYIRRSVTMDNGEQKDFLSDLLPSIAIAANLGQQVSIIAYNKPDFTHDITDWTQYQHFETVTAQFIQECFAQLQNDFIPTNENEEE